MYIHLMCAKNKWCIYTNVCRLLVLLDYLVDTYINTYDSLHLTFVLQYFGV